MDALRLLFASTVVVWHLFPLSHLAALHAPETPWINGTWAVRGFFVISGFLIFQSFESSRTGASYFEKRARRIYPAYFAVVMVCALAGAFFTKLPLSAYFGRDWLSYVVNNLAFLNYRHPALPGVFSGNPDTAVNGALWTIKVEVMFYVSVPALAWLFRKTQREIAIAVLYVLSVAFYMWFSWKAQQTGRDSYDVIAKQLPGQLCFFLAGAVLYYNFAFFTKYRKYLIPAALAAYVVATIFDAMRCCRSPPASSSSPSHSGLISATPAATAISPTASISGTTRGYRRSSRSAYSRKTPMPAWHFSSSRWARLRFCPGIWSRSPGCGRNPIIASSKERARPGSRRETASSAMRRSRGVPSRLERIGVLK